MNTTIIIPIATGILGIIAGAIPSYFSFKSKKMELQYSYNLSLGERNFNSSRAYMDTLYKPIYKILCELEQLVHDISLNNTYLGKDNAYIENTLCRIIMECDRIRYKDEQIYLEENIEVEFMQLYLFIKKSLICKSHTYGIRTSYNLFGTTSSSYSEETFNNESKVSMRMNIIKISNFISHMLIFFRPLSIGIVNVDYEVILKSSEIKSEEFRKEILRYVLYLKKQIKKVALGTEIISSQ